MITTQKELDAEVFAKQLNPNVKCESGINWNWAYGFSSYDQAKEFDTYCNKHGLETRGVYRNSNGTADVRYRS